MKLEKYQKKREFKKSPEPKGRILKKKKGDLIFVVQKHKATRLHYDLRLEHEGVLKSWAVPKKPSLKIGEKRLATLVEDHPLEYAGFEGTIPEGNYGAGTVKIWDSGVYHIEGHPERDESEKNFSRGFKKGELRVIFRGKKLKGKYLLIKFKPKKNGESYWLFFKAKQRRRALTRERLAKEIKKAMKPIPANPSRKGKIITTPSIPLFPRGKSKDNTSPNPSYIGGERSFSPDTKKLDGVLTKLGAKKSKIFHNIKPMLATIVKKPFDDNNWIFEIKFDGYRAIAEIDGENVRLYSRRNLDLSAKFPSIIESLRKIPFSAIFDGEIIVQDEKGRSSFTLLRNYEQDQKGRLIFYVFDILYFAGYDLRNLPLERRKEILKNILPKIPNIKYTDYVLGKGIKFFKLAKKEGLEGIMAKLRSSVYKTGKRSINWRKIKVSKMIKAIIAGYTEPLKGRKYFGSLILGLQKNGKLKHIGNVGTGFDDRLLELLYDKFQKIRIEKNPFEKKLKFKRKIFWIKPKYLCKIKFSEWTNDGRLRQPVFVKLE